MRTKAREVLQREDDLNEIVQVFIFTLCPILLLWIPFWNSADVLLYLIFHMSNSWNIKIGDFVFWAISHLSWSVDYIMFLIDNEFRKLLNVNFSVIVYSEEFHIWWEWVGALWFASCNCCRVHIITGLIFCQLVSLLVKMHWEKVTRLRWRQPSFWGKIIWRRTHLPREWYQKPDFYGYVLNA